MNILVALDFSAFTEPILAAVERIAAAVPETKIWLLHVAEPDPSFVGYEAGPAVVRDQVAAEYREERQRLHGYADGLRRSGRDVSTLIVQGAIAETIVAEADALDVQLIVMGSHGYGTIAELIVGGVSKVVLRKAACPVLIIPPALARSERA
ncbi:MAG TPA: universal stress protein [Gemmatimonadales bacterium]|nr:universal stress protein [Gemmatimonadales bacterium]